MAVGPALRCGRLVFPLVRLCNTLGRVDTSSGSHPDIDLSPLGLGLAASRRHAELIYRAGCFDARDLGSRLGTCINGEPLPRDEVRTLCHGDTLTIGGVTLTLDLECGWPAGLTGEWQEEVTGPHTILPSSGTLQLVGQLPQALRSGQLAMHYQAQVELATGATTSVEALIRWRHPDQGMVSPGKFVPLAEDTGFIRQLTTFAVAEAATQSRAWRAMGRPLMISVNVSVRDLEDRGFADRVCDAVQAADVGPRDLLLEVTESAVMTRHDDALAVMNDLRDLGFRFSIDDFGAGESSLGYLSRLPVDEVKIDQAFARDLTGRNQTIVRGAVSMAHDLGMSVVVEGIETADAADRLRDLGCDKGQGWYFGRPVPADEVAGQAA